MCILVLCTCGCVKAPIDTPSHITKTILPGTVAALPSPYSLTEAEKQTPWGMEYFLGKQFALQADYYRATTCFYRSLFLQSPKAATHPVVFHALILTYSIAGKYEETTALYERCASQLSIKDPKLALDCISLIAEAYFHQNRSAKVEELLRVIPPTEDQKQRLPFYLALSANTDTCFADAKNSSDNESMKKELQTLEEVYRNSKKHPETAAMLNAILPGAGYAYVRQYQTAATAFLFNGLFITATWQLLGAHQVAAGIISGGFEFGWYAGGIVGANMAAFTYNEQLRMQLLRPFLEKHALFPLQHLYYQW